jgi:branched-chain amino acid transport system ATP-binding protein
MMLDKESAPLLEARGIHAYYGASHVLQGINLDVRRGEAVGLMGRNGMGKTSLLRTLMGLLPPRKGSVRLHGRDVTHAPPHRIARADVAFVPEGRGIFANLSVRENLLMAARADRDGRRDWPLERVLALFPRLKERLGHGGQQLSGGEQQMLTIGRALMTNPRLLMLDEATEGMAPLIAQEIWDILRRIRATGMAAIVVDKNFSALSSATDRIVVLVKGRILFEGASAVLRADPEERRRLLGV